MWRAIFDFKLSQFLIEMAQRFANKVVIVTGSSSGIGQEAAVQFAREGASVVVHGQNEQRLQETEGLIADAGVPSERVARVLGSLEDGAVPARIMDAALARFGRIDVLVNNAAVGKKPGAEDPMGLDNLDYIFSVNFRSVVQLCTLALPHLEKTRGNVLNIGSVAGVRAKPQNLFYCTQKAALDHWTRGFAQMAAPKGVRVNSLDPGPIETPIWERSGSQWGQVLASATMLGRLGTPREVAAPMLFLCSDEAAYITGSVLMVDGGYHSNSGLCTQRTEGEASTT